MPSEEHRRGTRVVELKSRRTQEKNRRREGKRKAKLKINEDSAHMPDSNNKLGRKKKMRAVHEVVDRDVECELPEAGTSVGVHDAVRSSSGTAMPDKKMLGLILDRLKRRDTHKIFAEPVDGTEVEHYYDVIKEPMDFQTITNKLDAGSYKTLDDFEHDIALVYNNAFVFNASDTIFYKEAQAIKKLATKLLFSLKTDPENFGTESSRRSGCGDGKGSDCFASEPRQTYKAHTSALSEKSILSQICSGSKELKIVKENSCGYATSLMQFVKGLGPAAQLVAQRKLERLNAECPNLQIAPSQSSASNRENSFARGTSQMYNVLRTGAAQARSTMKTLGSIWDRTTAAPQTVPLKTGSTMKTLGSIRDNRTTAAPQTVALQMGGTFETLGSIWDRTTAAPQTVPLQTGTTMKTLGSILDNRTTAAPQTVPLQMGGTMETLGSIWDRTTAAPQTVPLQLGSTMKTLGSILDNRTTAAPQTVPVQIGDTMETLGSIWDRTTAAPQTVPLPLGSTMKTLGSILDNRTTAAPQKVPLQMGGTMETLGSIWDSTTAASQTVPLQMGSNMKTLGSIRDNRTTAAPQTVPIQMGGTLETLGSIWDRTTAAPQTVPLQTGTTMKTLGSILDNSTTAAPQAVPLQLGSTMKTLGSILDNRTTAALKTVPLQMGSNVSPSARITGAPAACRNFSSWESGLETSNFYGAGSIGGNVAHLGGDMVPMVSGGIVVSTGFMEGISKSGNENSTGFLAGISNAGNENYTGSLEGISKSGNENYAGCLEGISSGNENYKVFDGWEKNSKPHDPGFVQMMLNAINDGPDQSTVTSGSSMQELVPGTCINPSSSWQGVTEPAYGCLGRNQAIGSMHGLDSPNSGGVNQLHSMAKGKYPINQIHSMAEEKYPSFGGSPDQSTVTSSGSSVQELVPGWSGRNQAVGSMHGLDSPKLGGVNQIHMAKGKYPINQIHSMARGKYPSFGGGSSDGTKY